jgi:hypothetical protein
VYGWRTGRSTGQDGWQFGWRRRRRRRLGHHTALPGAGPTALSATRHSLCPSHEYVNLALAPCAPFSSAYRKRAGGVHHAGSAASGGWRPDRRRGADCLSDILLA